MDTGRPDTMSTTSSHAAHAPAVSFIVPCYNLGRYLDEAIQSILAQTVQDFEILVVDDGSTDADTRRLLADSTRPTWPQTRVIRSENRGLPAAKNLGLAHTSGSYVCMLDADDRLDPAFLATSKAVLDDDPSLAFVSHWFRTFGDEVWEWTPTRCDLEALLDANTVNGAALVRRTALEAVGGFDETMRDGCEDWDLWIALVERGLLGRILPAVLFHYRRRPDSMSRLMMEGDRHPALFRRLAEKHSESYRTHLVALLTRRERDASELAKHLHALELDYYRELAPEVAKRRDDIKMLGARRENVERDRALGRATARTQELEVAVTGRTEELHAMSERTQDLGATVSRQTTDLDIAGVRARELDAAANRAQAEADALRSSWSWRLTAPLRALQETFRRFSGGHRS